MPNVPPAWENPGGVGSGHIGESVGELLSGWEGAGSLPTGSLVEELAGGTWPPSSLGAGDDPVARACSDVQGTAILPPLDFSSPAALEERLQQLALGQLDGGGGPSFGCGPPEWADGMLRYDVLRSPVTDTHDQCAWDAVHAAC